MAKVYTNPKEHLVIILTDRETTKLGFGVPVENSHNICICDTCNNECSSNSTYYICGLNETMCENCAKDYCDNATHYVDETSINYEIRHFNYIASKLNMDERAALTPNGKCIIYKLSDLP